TGGQVRRVDGNAMPLGLVEVVGAKFEREGMHIETVARVVDHVGIVEKELEGLPRRLLGLFGKADDREEMERNACVGAVSQHAASRVHTDALVHSIEHHLGSGLE